MLSRTFWKNGVQLRSLNPLMPLQASRLYSPLPRNEYNQQSGRRRRREAIRAERIDDSQYNSPSYASPSVRYHNQGGIISPTDTVSAILSQPTLVIERNIEFMNLFLGFEQANRYTVSDPSGQVLGHLIERDFGIVKMMMRQVYRLHRPFTVELFDTQGNLLLTIKRPFSFINSHIKAILPSIQGDDESGGIIGESVQRWHLWRRRYNLFKSETGTDETYDQFGEIDSGLLALDFPVKDEQGYVLGAVSRNFVGFAREFLTDTGVYIVRMDPSSFYGLEDYYPNVSSESMTLDQRAVLLGNAVSIDFDYFSRHSNRGGLLSFGDYE
ncbi:unnamed protein product [Kuraishia capsulata CBS 1993]|uniref:Phospholipid scramblase n=1 Tax=Kuraishia capsulata CBS 1993 TaxID=1382522 RepID=W6MKR1_9ASCO|nr:uncharacterized protein KUCA_T00003041001 [Kuraishia capsulata CBS 1993]CDK27064.1 unnamed protein product [Kuraishia capsulata CBS 1993]